MNTPELFAAMEKAWTDCTDVAYIDPVIYIPAAMYRVWLRVIGYPWPKPSGGRLAKRQNRRRLAYLARKRRNRSRKHG